MDNVLTAGSPVEIEAKAEAAGLPESDRDTALALFHELTSRLELELLDHSSSNGGEPWPRHRFWFGGAAAVAGMVARLRSLDGVAEAPATAAVVFVTAEEGAFGALLAAGSTSDWLVTIGEA